MVVCLCLCGVFFFKQKTAYEMLRSLVGSEMCIRDRELKAATRRFAELFRQFEIEAAAVGSTVAELQVQLWEAWRAGDTGR